MGTGTVRLVLAGSALMLGLSSVTEGLLLLFPEETNGLYQWNQGSISQNGFGGVVQMAPVVLMGVIGLLLVGRRWTPSRSVTRRPAGWASRSAGQGSPWWCSSRCCPPRR